MFSQFWRSIVNDFIPIEGEEQESYLGKLLPGAPQFAGMQLESHYFYQWPPEDLLELIRRENRFVGSDPERAIKFLLREAKSWVGEEKPGTSYLEDPEFWDRPGAEAVKDGYYPRRVAPQFIRLLEEEFSRPRYNMILIPDHVFQGMPCIISIHFEPLGDTLYVSEVFRTVELSRNLVNDLFILGYLIHKAVRTLVGKIHLVDVNLFMVNPHIIQE